MDNFYIHKIKKNTILFIGGESNSGGIGPNSSATSDELSINKMFNIWDNVNNNGVNPLHIGVNNLLGHRGLESYVTTSHGMELPLSNYVKSNHFKSNNVLLFKFGQGGTIVSNWMNESQYIDIYPWKVFVYRMKRLKQYIDLRTFKVKLIISLGINDGIAGTDPTVFKTKLKLWLGNIQKVIGYKTEIYATQIMSNYSAINNKILECQDELDNFHAIETPNPGNIGYNHWDYAQFKIIVDNMVNMGL